MGTFIKYLICVSLVCLSVSSLKAQEAPDDDAIHRAILNRDSIYYYPNLFGRYLAGDATLTPEDYRHLYYGYVWQDTYRPLATAPAWDRMLVLLEQNPEPNAGFFHGIIENGTELMRTEPFNPNNINLLTYAYGGLGDSINERINARRLEMIVRTIKSTGTGLSEYSPWHIISFSHANDLMVMMGLQTLKSILVSRSIMFIPLLQRQDGIRGYYFNYERIYWFPPDTPSETRPGWEINGIPVPRR